MTTNLPRNAQGKIQLGDIHVGESRTFDVVFSPPDDTDFGYHHDSIILKGTNSEQEFEINLYALITSSLRGSVYFHVVNILNREVEGATIRLRNTDIREETAPVSTDINGEALIEDLQEGLWSWQVVAQGHASLTGVVEVVADQVVSVEPILSRNLVTINFYVEPVPFTDRYEIKIEQTFETHIPIPVLILDPPFYQFEVEPGFTTNVIVKLTNYGLVKVRDLTISSHDIGIARQWPLIEYIPELGPMQSMEIPYHIEYYGEGEEGLSGETTEEGVIKKMVDCWKEAKSFFSNLKGRAPCAADESVDVSIAVKELFKMCDRTLGKLVPAVGAIGCENIAYVLYWLGCLFADSTDEPYEGTGEHLEGVNYLTKNGKPGGSYPSFSGSTGPPCFVEGTPIMMADGSVKPIEEIRVGDEVMAFDGKSDTVKRVHQRESDHVREVWYRSEEGELRRLETTDGHLLWIEGKEWIPARKAETGDNLMSLGACAWKVEKNERFEKPATVYNFDVHLYRSYFAGGVLVHERCGVIEEEQDNQILLQLEGCGCDGGKDEQ
jgi:hypothetical protein